RHGRRLRSSTTIAARVPNPSGASLSDDLLTLELLVLAESLFLTDLVAATTSLETRVVTRPSTPSKTRDRALHNTRRTTVVNIRSSSGFPSLATRRRAVRFQPRDMDPSVIAAIAGVTFPPRPGGRAGLGGRSRPAAALPPCPLPRRQPHRGIAPNRIFL